MWPFRKTAPREDWRMTHDYDWRTVSRAGDYVEQRYCYLEVRFPDGAERWTPYRSYCPRIIKQAVL